MSVLPGVIFLLLLAGLSAVATTVAIVCILGYESIGFFEHVSIVDFLTEFARIAAARNVYIVGCVAELDGVKLKFGKGALTKVANMAASQKSGARGLRAILEEILLNVMFDLPSRDDVVEVRVTEACITNGSPQMLEIAPKRKKKEA